MIIRPSWSRPLFFTSSWWCIAVLLFSNLDGFAKAQIEGCLRTLNPIGSAELGVMDFSVRRVYTLCPGTVFETGEIVNGRIEGGQPPLNLRPNMTVQCGTDAMTMTSESRDADTMGECIITGKVGIIGSSNNVAMAGSIIIRRIVFQELEDVGVFVRATGSIDFIDCIFRRSNAVPNIHLESAIRISRRSLASSNESIATRTTEDPPSSLERIEREIDLYEENLGFSTLASNWNQQRKLQSSSSLLTVLFSGCTFEENSVGLVPGINYTMINLPRASQRTTFDRCLFQRNDYGSRVVRMSFQSLIFNAGQSLEILNSCFLNNRVWQLAPIITLGQTPVIIQDTVVVPNANDIQTNCPVVVQFPDAVPGSLVFSNPVCLSIIRTTSNNNFGSDQCQLGGATPVLTLPPVPPGAAPCIDDLSTLARMESRIPDPTDRREYILCPNTIFDTTGGAQSPLVIRQNITILCGESGSNDNNCTITGGRGAVGNPRSFDQESDNDIGYVEISGITFSNLTRVFFIGLYSGVVNITDCIFENSRAAPNIYLESPRPSRRFLQKAKARHHVGAISRVTKRRLQEDPVLDVTFTSCRFEGNGLGTANGINYVLMFLASEAQSTTFRRCIFRGNDFGSEVLNPVTQALIFNNGGNVRFERNCFFDNQVLMNGLVNSVSLSVPQSENNFGSPPTTPNSECDFIGWFQVRPGGPLRDPACIDFESNTCLADSSSSPPSIPTPSPTIKGSKRPTPNPTPFFTPPPGCTGNGRLCSVDTDCCSRSCRIGVNRVGVCRSMATAGGRMASFKLSGILRGGAAARFYFAV